jgi:AcrR family transcriptional regulator
MKNGSTKVRKERSDALRSRTRLLQSARKLLCAGDADLPIDAIARDAEVGVGTFYRHFENRRALLLAVYRHEIDALCAEATRHLEELPRDQALRSFGHGVLEYAARNAGLARALGNHTSLGPSDLSYGGQRILWEVINIIARAGPSALRDDVKPETIAMMLNALCTAAPSESWLTEAKAVLDVFFDGLERTERTPSPVAIGRER